MSRTPFAAPACKTKSPTIEVKSDRRARVPVSWLEPLEHRRMCAVTQDAAGWTVVTPATDTRLVYVSSSGGDDARDGSSPALAVATLNRAKALVRNGFADWMLLKRGDVFGSFGTWNKWGRSTQQPLYITAFGDPLAARPQINSGNTFGLNTVTSTNANGVENIVISSLSFFPETYNHTSGGGDLAGLRFTAKGRNVLIEDCKVAGYKDNIVISGESASFQMTDVVIRRSQILDSHAAPSVGRSQGIYVGASGKRVTIEQNVVDHNGWRANTTGDRSDMNHNIYAINNATDIIVRDNIDTQASFYGAKMNSGGTVTGNFFARNSESVYMENHTHAEGNVITEAVDLDRTPTVPTVTPWGVGINTQSSPSATIRHNLITKVLSTNASGVAGIQLFNQGGVAFSGVVDFNTVYSWRNGLLITAAGNGPGSVVIRDNDLQAVFASTAAAAQRSSSPASTFAFANNVYSSGTPATANKVGNNLVSLGTWNSSTSETNARYQTLAYPNANRSIADYNASVGGAASFDAFIATARAMQKTNWNTAYTAAAINPWFWDGFDKGQPPAVLAARPSLQQLPQSVDLTFSKDVGASLSGSDVQTQNLTTGASVSSTLVYSRASTIGRLTFGPALPDGNYRITIPAGAITDRAGRPSTANQVVNFFLYRGDANFDRTVNLDDFTLLAPNFGQTGRVFSQGDFNYDDAVNLDDFTLLAAQFGKTLPASSDLPRADATPAAVRPARPLSSAGLFAERAIGAWRALEADVIAGVTVVG